MTAPPIEVRGLVRRFGDVTALNGLDVDVSGPGVFGFLGVNGAGKTTTFRILTGLIRAHGGSARLFGVPVENDDTSIRSRIGFLPQHPAAYDWMTGDEFLRHVGRLLGLTPDENKAKRAGLLDRCGLTKAARRRVGGYSGGMKQRLGIAQAMMGKPDLLLLDEPVSALDPVGRAEILDLIQDLGGEVCVFFSTHILADVERVCREVTILHEGRSLLREAISALREKHLVPVFEIGIVGDSAAFLKAVKKLEIVSEAKSVANENGVETFRVKTANVDGGRIEIPAIATDLKLPLAFFRSVNPTLEEIFLGLIGAEGAQDDGPSDGSATA